MAPQTHELMQVEEEKREVIEEKKNGETTNKGFPFYMLLCYADTLDWTLMALGTLGSVVHGMAQPVGYLLLGKALNAFGDNIDNTDGMVKALKKVYTHKLHQLKIWKHFTLDFYEHVSCLFVQVVPFVWYMAFATFPAGVLGILSLAQWY